MAKEIDCDHTDEPVCPYCGETYGDFLEIQENEDFYKCDCGKIFHYEREYEVHYWTRKIDCCKHFRGYSEYKKCVIEGTGQEFDRVNYECNNKTCKHYEPLNVEGKEGEEGA